MLSIKVLPQTNLRQDYAHSVLISLLRGLAALVVAAAHLRAQSFPAFGSVIGPSLSFQVLAFVSGFAHQAVVVFFLLSGWLVGGSFLNKYGREHAIRDYAIDRLTRLWIVLVPTFLAILAFGAITGKIDPATANMATDNDYSATAFLGNLLGLQNMLVPTFGGNFPLWSLSNETWYYVLFPLLVVGWRPATTTQRVLAAGGVAILGIFALLLNGPVLLYFSIWLLGAAASRIKITAAPLAKSFMLFLFVGLASYFRLKGKNNGMAYDAFVQDAIFSVAFVCFLCSTQVPISVDSIFHQSARRVGKFFADFSFTLYVLHVPLIGGIVFFSSTLSTRRLSPHSATDMAIYLGSFVLIVAISYLFHLPFEANTQRLRTFFKRNVAQQKIGLQGSVES